MQCELIAQCVQILSIDVCQHYDARSVVGHVHNSQCNRPLLLAERCNDECMKYFTVSWPLVPPD